MAERSPKQIGLLIGREWSWPSAFIAEVNNRDAGAFADFVKIGETFMESLCAYDVIVDRMSHEIAYYRTYLKFAAINGCYIVNNPFVVAADDKFFGIALSQKLGVTVPRTVALPNKRVETENVPESFRNLIYPMDWQGIIDFVGVPAILKDAKTGGRRLAHRVNNVDELIRWYDESDTLTVILQQIIESDTHIHCFVIGRRSHLTVRYSMEDGLYQTGTIDLPQAVGRRIGETSLEVTRAYGYDINMVEYVLHQGEPVLINPSNPVPELDINLLTADHFNWCVHEAADFAVDMALNPRRQFLSYEWYGALEETGSG